MSFPYLALMPETPSARMPAGAGHVMRVARPSGEMAEPACPLAATSARSLRGPRAYLVAGVR